MEGQTMQGQTEINRRKLRLLEIEAASQSQQQILENSSDVRGNNLNSSAASMMSPQKKQQQQLGKPANSINPFYLPPHHHGGLSTIDSNFSSCYDSHIAQNQTIIAAKKPSSSIRSKISQLFRSVCCCEQLQPQQISNGDYPTAPQQTSDDQRGQTDNGSSLYSYQKDWAAGDLTASRKSNNMLLLPDASPQTNTHKKSTASQRNSMAAVIDVLHYKPGKYCSMRLGHYSFLQIPVRFEHHQNKRKVSFIDLFARTFCDQQESSGALIIQACLDADFAESLGRTSSHVTCVFGSAHPVLPRSKMLVMTAPLVNITGGNSIGKSAIMQSSASQASSAFETSSAHLKLLESMQQKPEFSKVEFIQSIDTNFTLRTEGFGKIVIVPASLKQPASAFDLSLRMTNEIKKSLIASIHEFAEVLEKVVVVLPKYAKIHEVVFLIFEAFSQTTKTIQQLNLGIQVHTLIDDSQDVDALVLVFDTQQHMDTLAALSHRVFSNINPTAGKRKSPVQDSNEFLDEVYVSQLGRCTLKNLYLFLKHFNACYILPTNTFAYRTFVLDAMLVYGVIDNDFIPHLIQYFTVIDRERASQEVGVDEAQVEEESSYSSASKKKLAAKQMLQSSQISRNPPEMSFKEHFLCNSREYRKPISDLLGQLAFPNSLKDEGSYGSTFDVQNTTVDTEVQAKVQLTPVDERNDFHSRNIVNSNVLENGGAQSRDSPIVPSQISEENPTAGGARRRVVENRSKVQSCSVYTGSSLGKNLHVGFKARRLAEMQAKAVEDEEKIKETATTTSSRNRSIKDNEILNHTTATRIVFETNEQPKIIGKIYGRKYSEA